jgi:hypothetical protein
LRSRNTLACLDLESETKSVLSQCQELFHTYLLKKLSDYITFKAFHTDRQMYKKQAGRKAGRKAGCQAGNSLAVKQTGNRAGGLSGRYIKMRSTQTDIDSRQAGRQAGRLAGWQASNAVRQVSSQVNEQVGCQAGTRRHRQAYLQLFTI